MATDLTCKKCGISGPGRYITRAGVICEQCRAAEAAPVSDGRAEFEAWATKRGCNVKRYEGEITIYIYGPVQLAWEAWQQARRGQEPQPMGALSGEDDLGVTEDPARLVWRDGSGLDGSQAYIGDYMLDACDVLGHTKWAVYWRTGDGWSSKEENHGKALTMPQAKAEAEAALLRVVRTRIAAQESVLRALDGNSARQAGGEGDGDE